MNDTSPNTLTIETAREDFNKRNYSLGFNYAKYKREDFNNSSYTREGLNNKYCREGFENRNCRR
jgi:hypothetical protein